MTLLSQVLMAWALLTSLSTIKILLFIGLLIIQKGDINDTLVIQPKR